MEMRSVTYDDRSFLVDGERIWLVSGSVHYFRCPAGTWADRLLKAKRGGLNCVSTYVAWNFHEQVEGRWQLTGDHDIEGFVKLAKELGLYVILKPGPYIRSEWDFGGLPGWLTSKSGIAFRTSNAAFTHYYDKYFRQVLPRLAEHQVTRGGNIVLIQNENEYLATTMPERLAYLEFISQLFRRSGFDIPIITCNGATDPPVPDAVDCVNGCEKLVPALKTMRLRQANAPLLVGEFRIGGADQWGGPHNQRPAKVCARKAMEVLGCAGQFNYHMWQGGTNFAFWGGRSSQNDAAYQTTSYDCDAPVAEGGGLTEKYYLLRPVNMLANHMGRFFAHCKMNSVGAGLDDSTGIMNIDGPLGAWAIVSNGGREEISSVRLSPLAGPQLHVPLEPFGAAAVPLGLKLTPEHTLDYANLTPLGLFWNKVLVLHGPAGWQAVLSVNGRRMDAVVPDGEEPKILQAQDLQIVLISSSLASRAWLVDEMLLMGPQFVGTSAEEIIDAPHAKQYAVLSSDGKLAHHKVKPSPRHKPVPPRLGDWKRVAVCVEPVSEDLAWEKMDRLRDVDHLGAHYGYVWHRVVMQHPSAQKRHLLLPHCEDRAVLYLNGKLLGVWGRGEGATRQPIAAAFKQGRNVLAMLVDNLGRFYSSPRLGEFKGLRGPIYDARPLPVRKPKVKAAETFPRRSIPRHLTHWMARLEAMPAWEVTYEVPLRQVTPIHLSFADVPNQVAVLCNGRTVDFFPGHGRNFGDATFGPDLKSGKNVIQLLLWGQIEPQTLARFKFHLLQKDLTDGAELGYRRFSTPQPGGLIVGKDRPAWYVANFKHAHADVPLFLHIVGAGKGQMYLNGHNLGRFWTIGPQPCYYLPEPWLMADNELLIFEEHGEIPRRSRLEFRPAGPYRE